MTEMKKILVIGNGFDLAIGAKTSYKAFFESEYYEEITKKVFIWIDLVEKQMRNSSALNTVNMLDFDFNFWDLLFSMESKIDSGFNEKANWCDVERVIHDSLIDFSPDKFSWRHTYDLLHSHFYENERQPGDFLKPRRKISFPYAVSA